MIDLCQWLCEDRRVIIAKQTLRRELRRMGYCKLSARLVNLCIVSRTHRNVGDCLGGMSRDVGQHVPVTCEKMARCGYSDLVALVGIQNAAWRELEDEVGLLMKAFFTQSERSQAAGCAFVERLKLRIDDRVAPVSKQAAIAQLAAIREWGLVPQKDRFAMLGQLHHPTLVVHGNKDVVVMPTNAFLLAVHLPNAQLIMYPDASHGAQSQHTETFLQHAKMFLNR